MTLQAIGTDRGKRLDSLLHEQLPRSADRVCRAGFATGVCWWTGKSAKSSARAAGRLKSIVVEPGELPPLKATAEDIPLTVLYEDDSVDRYR